MKDFGGHSYTALLWLRKHEQFRCLREGNDGGHAEKLTTQSDDPKGKSGCALLKPLMVNTSHYFPKLSLVLDFMGFAFVRKEGHPCRQETVSSPSICLTAALALWGSHSPAKSPSKESLLCHWKHI